MWGQIAKLVDVAMAAETPSQIEEYQINHIVKAILDRALPKFQEKCRAKSDSQDKSNANRAIQPGNQEQPATWASIAAQNPPKAFRSPTKLSLA